MNWKKPILASLKWTGIVVILSIGAIFYVISNPVRGMSPEERGTLLGQGMGIVASIGYAVIWLPLAFRAGAEKRQAQQRKAQQRKKKSAR